MCMCKWGGGRIREQKVPLSSNFALERVGGGGGGRNNEGGVTTREYGIYRSGGSFNGQFAWPCIAVAAISPLVFA